MASYLIRHSPRLSGEVEVSTAKNAVLPILAAGLLTEDPLIVKEVPQITDVDVLLQILRDCGAEAIVGMACGDGVQTVADNIQLPIYPANDTMFLGQVERVGMFHEYCRMCGDCVLGQTGGICPITKCAKSLVNGPCGSAKNGKCEVNPENDCAWIQIYNRMVALGQEDLFLKTRKDKGHGKNAYPRHINLRGKK